MAAPERLLRLARTQGEIGNALEQKLAAEERRIGELTRAAFALAHAVDETGPATLAFRTAALRRMVDAERALSAAQREAALLRRQLIAARTREKALHAQAQRLAAAAERKTAETEMLEAVTLFAAKASGKPDVVD